MNLWPSINIVTILKKKTLLYIINNLIKNELKPN